MASSSGCGFALALLPDPLLLILDEPTTGMDVTTRRGFWSSIREDAATGRTVIFATHYLEEADAYADRIVLLRHGHVAADGSSAELKALASGRTVRAWLPHADVASLTALPGVDAVERRGDSVLVHGSDSDAVARHLLTRTDARDVEITSRNLEDAFVALTGDDAEGDSGMTTTDAMPMRPNDHPVGPTPGRPSTRRLLLDVRPARAAPHAPEPPHGDLHPGHAGGLLPAVRDRSRATATDSAGNGNVTAYVLISMAVYGAMLATTSGGASVSIERAAGWSRQLRLTPLRPIAYVAVKVTVAMTMALASVLVVSVVGSFSGAEMPADVWVLSLVLAWACAVVFAAFGLFMGYLLPSENVMQILGPVLALLSFAGGLFVPLDQMGDTFAGLAKVTPVYGVGVIARYPLTHDGSLAVAVLNVLVWTTVFAVGAAWRFRRDTARV